MTMGTTDMSITVADWKTDVHWGTIDLYVPFDRGEGRGPTMVHAFLQKRPYYCDRGHWSFNVDGIPDMDGADSFPRYYMDLEAAMCEVADFLNWRLFQLDIKPGVTLDDRLIRS